MDRIAAGGGRARGFVSGIRWPEPPAGFVLRAGGDRALYVAEAFEGELCLRGLHDENGWDNALATGARGSGRGTTAIVPGPTGTPWRLKRMRRGGSLAPLWRDRYVTAGRPVATLAATEKVRARGVPTAAPIALSLASGRGGLVEAAMAVEEIERSEDLARRIVSGRATGEELAAAVNAVRAMHDRGVVHPDLNLGNILLRPGPGAAPEAFVIDFDRATFTPGPVPFALRQAAVRRLERSCAKLTGAPGPAGDASGDPWYDLYAGADETLARRFAQGRAAGRLWVAVHRLGWKRSRG